MRVFSQIGGAGGLLGGGGSLVTVTRTNVESFIQKLNNMSETADGGVRVGVLEAPDDIARNSLALEHRWQGAGPSHWHEGPRNTKDYVRWAFAARTAKTVEKKYLSDWTEELFSKGILGDAFWGAIGQRTAQKMQQIMLGIQTPENRPSTIRQSPYKNASDPLIGDETMLSNVTYRITDGETEEITETPKSVPAF